MSVGRPGLGAGAICDVRRSLQDAELPCCDPGPLLISVTLLSVFGQEDGQILCDLDNGPASTRPLPAESVLVDPD